MPQLNNMLLLWLLNIFYVVAVSDTNPVSIQKRKNPKIGFITNKNFKILKDRKLFCVCGMNNFFVANKIQSGIKIFWKVRNVGFFIFSFSF